MKSKYELRAGAFLLYGICVGTSVLIPYSYLTQPQDQGIAILFGVSWTFLLLALYQALMRCGIEGADIFDLIKSSFGNLISRVLWSVYGLYIVLMISKDLAIVWGTMGNMALPKYTPPICCGHCGHPSFSDLYARRYKDDHTD